MIRQPLSRSTIRTKPGVLRAWACRTAAALAVAVCLFPTTRRAAAASSPDITLRWRTDSADTNRTVVEASGIPKQSLRTLAQVDWPNARWQELLSAVTESGNLFHDVNLPPLAGSYHVNGDTLRFAPAFPLAAGVTYRATFRPSALPDATGAKASPVSATHRIASRKARPTTVVSAIYPSTSVLPENLLKFYLHFSAPMSRGHIYDHIHLRDARGQNVELPFLEIDEELWNPNMTRLTLFLDPGRIKRGVRPLEEVGPSLEEGQSYTLVIAPEWQDATGTPLREGFSKKLTVGPADREPPDPDRWTLEAPAARSLAVLRLKFPESLDHALLERVLRVSDASGKTIAGAVTVGAEERTWSFVPTSPWRAGRYQVQLPATIEDLAGNNIGKSFDVDLFERVERRMTNIIVTLPFTAQ